MPNHAGVLQSRFFPAKLEAEGDDAIFNTLLGDIYGGRYPEHGDFMLFGTQGIHLPSFVQIVVLTARLPRHFEKT